MATATTRSRAMRELRGKEHVPFIPDMEADGFPEAPEGFVLPVTAAVFHHCFELLPPAWFNHCEYITGEGHGCLYYFWQDGTDYYCVRMSQEQTEQFVKPPAKDDKPQASATGIAWRVECKFSGKGHDVEGSFDDAVRDAQAQCTTDSSKWVVWAEPANVRMAEVTLRGAIWTKTSLTGEEVKSLMRRHKKTIAQLSFIMGITQKRIRQVRERGLDDAYAVRDWLQAITDEDPGPLPERYRVSGRDQEGDCGYCGCPLFAGDAAYEYASGIFCSVSCSRQSRNWGKEQPA